MNVELDQLPVQELPGLGFSLLPAPAPVCFFSRIEAVPLTVSVCANFSFESLRADQPFEHCQYCQCWNGEPF